MRAQEINERRRAQRVVFESPLPAVISGLRVQLLDLSVFGARIEHDAPLAARKEMKLRFERGGESFSVTCEIVRCRLQRSAVRPGTVAYCSGIRFTAAAEASRETVRALVAQMLGRGGGGSDEVSHSGVAV